MAVSLQKGQKVDLTKNNPSLSKIMVGLGWDVQKRFLGPPFDLDASTFLTDITGRCPSRSDFVNYRNLRHPSQSVRHMGDNLTGEGEGDDEQIFVNLHSIPDNIQKLIFVVDIFNAAVRHQNFGQVSNAFIRLVDLSTNQELCRYDLGREFSDETVVVVGEIYRHGSNWKFSAVGGGYKQGMTELRRQYGV